MRALLLSAYMPEKVDAAIERAVQTTSRKVLTLLSLFLSNGAEAFHTDLKTLLYEAAEVWKEAQHSKKMVKASMKDEEEWLWDDLDEFNSVATPTEVQPDLQKFEMLNLFPRIFVPEDETKVYSGVVLWSDQNVVHAADQELRDYIRARRTCGGRGLNGSVSTRRERRQSLLIDGRDRGIVSVPIGSRVGNTGSFLEKPQPRSQILGNETKNGNRGEG